MILAIDPGSTETGFCLLRDDFTIIEKGKILNEDMITFIKNAPSTADIVIEMVASYGMAVGKTVFETCVWVGRFHQAGINGIRKIDKMYRKDIKMNICGMTRAKDSNIRQALVDRFSFERHLEKGGKGTKKDPGFFFGFKSDIWAAFAVGVTYLDMRSDNDSN